MKLIIRILTFIGTFFISIIAAAVILATAFPNYPILAILVFLLPLLLAWTVDKSLRNLYSLRKKTLKEDIGFFEFSKRRAFASKYHDDVENLFSKAGKKLFYSESEYYQQTQELRFLAETDLNIKNRLARMDEAVQLKLTVIEHQAALNKNIQKAIRRNDYGAIISDDRIVAVEEFLDSVPLGILHHSREEALELVSNAIESIQSQLAAQGFDPASLPSDGFEFEIWVAENLKKFGWDAQPTNGSGDQGLDVIAEKNGVKVGLQCKLYGSNVGNKAVQEIVSARAFFGFQKAAVISNAEYTKSAIELAQTADVLLLSHHQISSFDSLFL